MRFNVGDRVQITGGLYHCFAPGAVGMIVYAHSSTLPTLSYTVCVDDTEQYVYEKDLCVPGPRRLHAKD